MRLVKAFTKNALYIFQENMLKTFTKSFIKYNKIEKGRLFMDKKEFIDFQNVKEIMNYATKEYPDNVAFTIKHKKGKEVSYTKKTYTDLNEEINVFGTALLHLGLKDKRVAIIGKNRYEWVLSYITVIDGVGIAVPLDKGLPEQEIILSLQEKLFLM